MKNSFGVIACALSILFYFCSGDYFVGEGSLYDHGIYDGSKDSLAYDPYNMGYFCQSTQKTFFDDLASPTPLVLLTGGQSPTTHSHDACVRFFKLQLSNTDIRKYIKKYIIYPFSNQCEKEMMIIISISKHGMDMTMRCEL